MRTRRPHRLRAGAATLAGAIALSLMVVGAPGAHAATTTITVTVLDDATGLPVAACADAVGFDAAGSFGAHQVCSTTGTVIIDSLVVGNTYQVLGRAADPGSYLVPTWGTDGPVYDNPGSDYPAPAVLTIRLPTGGRISGHLTDWTGAPTVGTVNITAQGTGFIPAGSPGGYSPGNFEVDASGNWTTQLVPGAYHFEFDHGMQRSWAFGRRSIGQADTVQVAAGAQVVVDQQIPKPGTVSGHLYESGTGTPVAGACLFLTDSATRNIPGSDYACSGADGSYQTGYDTPAGSWVLQITDPSGAHPLTYSAPFTLATGQALTGFDVILPRSSVVTGVAKDARTGAPIAGACPSAAYQRTSSYAQQTGGSCSGADGRWTLTAVPPGDFTIQLTGGGSHATTWAPASLTQANAQVYSVTEGSTLDIGTVSMIQGATLAGRVTDRAGRPVAGAEVTTNDYCGCPDVPAVSAYTDADGRYTVGGLTPGRTVALVVAPYDSGLAFQWTGHATDPKEAERLTLRDRATTTWNVRLDPEVPLTVTRHGGPANDSVLVRAQTSSGSFVGWWLEPLDGETVVIHGLPASNVKVSYTYGSWGSLGTTGWYDGATTFRKARKVSLRSGAAPSVVLTVPAP